MLDSRLVLISLNSRLHVMRYYIRLVFLGTYQECDTLYLYDADHCQSYARQV